MERTFWVTCLFLLSAVSSCTPSADRLQEGKPALRSVDGKPRVIVLTDIGNEPDDAQSLVRFLVYSNEFDVEGIIATTSTWLRDDVRVEIIRDHVQAYDRVRDRLLEHAPDYPTADDLLKVVKAGLDEYGMRGVGRGKSSAGSQRIISAVDKEDDRPLWITIWGGANCLAQALWLVRDTRSPEQVDLFVDKLRVYSISDQDDSGPWIRENFPQLFYIVSPSSTDGKDYPKATWTGISGDKLHGFTGPDFGLVDNPWLTENIRTGHGPLGERYPATEHLMEGDTPSFLNLVPNGLAADRDPSWGGWGGRYELSRPEKETRPIFTNTKDTVIGSDGKPYTTAQATIWRWRKACQNDFAARMDWCVAPSFDEANHNPVVILNGNSTKEPVFVAAEPGQTLKLSAQGSRDPDNRDTLNYTWWVYREAGSYPGTVSLQDDTSTQLTLTVPGETSGTAFHVILEVTDSGTPPLTSYRRAVVEVKSEDTPAK